MKNLIQFESYQNLEHHIQKLLEKSENGFGNKNEYILFLAYLIVSDDYKKRIETVDTSLQLLLDEPEKFWLAPFSEEDHQDIKRHLIKSIILQELELYIQNNRNHGLQNLSQIDSFIQKQKSEFKKQFQHQEFPTVFSHNMDFSLPRNHPQINLQTIKKYYSITSGILNIPTGAWLGALLGWNYVDSILKQSNNSFKELNFFEKRSCAKTIMSSLFLGSFFIALFSFLFFHKTLKSINTDNNSSWEKINLDEFINYCCQDNRLVSLIEETNSIDGIWWRKSHLSLFSSQSQSVLRGFLLRELNSLKQEMDNKEFHQLLICLILNDHIPDIKKISYDLPIQFLRNTQNSWFPESLRIHLDKDYNHLIKLYAKLIMIEYLGEELSTSNYTSDEKTKFYNFLLQEKEKIKKGIIYLNNTELPKLIHPEIKQLLKYIFYATTATISGTSTILYKLSYSNDIDLDNFSDWDMLALICKLLVLFLLSGVATASVSYVATEKIPQIYSDYLDNTTLSLLFAKTLKKAPELKILFSETKKLQ